MSCKEFRNIIEKYIDGDIEDILFNELINHAQQCPYCEKEFKDLGRLENIIKSSLSSATTAEQAMDSILSRLQEI